MTTLPQIKIVFTVINDLTYDQRMQRIAHSLVQAGYQVTLVGRELNTSKPINKDFIFYQKRLKCFFNKGKFFYAEYNIRLFFYLLFNTFDIYGATDLDTLLPNFAAAKLKKKPHTYDAHEYFTELPEIVNRPIVQKIWKLIEKTILPRTQYAYTINHSYKQKFEQEYPNTCFEIIRNATILKTQALPTHTEKVQAPYPFNQKYILYQGAVNIGRGVEEMIQAMPYITDYKLYICGKGDVLKNCQQLTKELNLQERVFFWGHIEPNALRQFTQYAAMGFTFFTQQGESYYYSLANRFFDYFHNGVPQLAMQYPEYEHINTQFEIAVLLPNLQINTIATATNQLLANNTHNELYKKLHANCLEAREVINWQNEAQKLVAFYNKIELKK